MWNLKDVKKLCSQSADLGLDTQRLARVGFKRTESSLRIETYYSHVLSPFELAFKRTESSLRIETCV